MNNSKILALKYRPQEFKDLIGQEVIAQTIVNAIKLGKTPNAYLLTGIRGIGKTTTARLIAKALNCIKNSDSSKKCSPESFCDTCKEIVSSNHIDVLEMDAASKTGIDDVRELIENSKYSPTSASYKIFIIDEVHMLSKQAFNGLLKTLEEPPERLKFILATTEVRKIPVTILSRCQRFDLKRVNLQKLFLHIKDISKKEVGKISDEALKIIARASEGSVRDALSLLDRALITEGSGKDKEINDQDVRKMLGLADRSKIIHLFKEILSGEQKKAVDFLKEMIEEGLDARYFLNDILEILHLFSRRVNLGPIEKDNLISESEIKMIDDYSKNLNMQDLGLFWQLTIKTIDDLKLVSNENLSLEMYILQLIHLKDIESTKDIKINDQEIKDNGNFKKIDNQIESDEPKDKKKIKNITTSQLKNTEQIQISQSKKIEVQKNIQIEKFEDLIKLAEKEKEIELKYDLERNVRLVNFQKGKIDIGFNEKLNKDFIKLLTEKLLVWTGERWIISLSKDNNLKTFHEQKIEKKQSKLENEKNSEVYKEVSKFFPDSELIDVSETNE
ncbi:MAG: DNA polymerase III subunit gamma/tau [Pelagibacteraceae bacterium]